jgi:hypothetical protein
MTKLFSKNETTHYIFKLSEPLISWVIIIAVSIYAGLFFNAMATSSLWHDEIVSIVDYSSQGIIKTVTDYYAPNNHIFFNFLNALIPGDNFYYPLRARLWSFIFMISTAILVIGYFFRRSYFLEGSLFFTVFFLNDNILRLNLEARGYGLLFFFATATSVLTIEYVKTNNNAYLSCLALLTVLGTWTIPTYGFFGGTVLALLFLYQRNIKTFITGLFTVLLIVFLYLPVADQILHHAHHYGARWGYHYASIDAIMIVFHHYLFNGVNILIGWAFGTNSLGRLDWLIFLLLALVFLGVGVLFSKDDKLGKGLQLLTLSIIIFFSICLFMQTPLPRTTVFIVPVFFILLLLLFNQFCRYPKLQFFRPILSIILVFIVGLSVYLKVKHFSFIPRENWLEAARFINENFDRDTLIFGVFDRTRNRPPNLRAYLDKEYKIVDQFNAKEFKNGKLIVVGSDFLKPEKDRLNATKLDKLAKEVKIPQHGGGYLGIIFIPTKNIN